MKYKTQVISRETCFEGFFQVVRYRLRHRLFQGGWSGEIIRDRIEFLNAVAVVLYDPLRDQVVMVEQFRIGALEDGRGAWTLEPVGGIVKNTEDPIEVAKREAMEEAGCRVDVLERIGVYHVSPGTAADRVRLYCGRVNAGMAGGVYGVKEESEDTRVQIMDLEQAIQELFVGRVNTTTAIIGLQWLAMNRERLRVEWNRRE